MSKISIFSILKKSHYAQVGKPTIEAISKMLVARTENTGINLCELIEHMDYLIQDLQIDSSGEVKMSDRAQFITYFCILIKFIEPMMEQIDTIIDKEIKIVKIKD